MVNVESIKQFFARPDRLSYAFMLLLVIATAWLHLSVLLVAALFSYLLLSSLTFGNRLPKYLALLLFLTILTGLSFGVWVLMRHTVAVFPGIADKAIPTIIEWSRTYNMDVPFTDFESLRETIVEGAASQMRHLGSFAHALQEVGTKLLYLIGGIVVAVSLFLNSRFELGREPDVKPNNFYSVAGEHLGTRFRRFYESFSRVFGAQILISLINSALTGIFAVTVGLPYALLVVGITFLCGLLPVIGNLISNTIIVFIGFTVSPGMALSALIFLIVIHKLEYFLNSKIIGRRIRNPLWMTLIGIVVGERLMGVSGIILAPVILHYLKKEASSFEVPPETNTPVSHEI